MYMVVPSMFVPAVTLAAAKPQDPVPRPTILARLALLLGWR